MKAWSGWRRRVIVACAPVLTLSGAETEPDQTIRRPNFETAAQALRLAG